MALAPEPYAPRRIAHIDTWRTADHAIKVYGIHRDPNWASPLLSDAVIASARASVQDGLTTQARDHRSHGLGFCIVHVGEEARLWRNRTGSRR
ncbi:hypothetical protein G6F50_017387 [Rhizopus delemar]|uniref:Uncharacterized protein n=1 Tax=Rhizopus delemar TaxID=936053 RepID=A0A9P7C0V4_9FUNG|nr:hypothetical protein G6F50_017387 [Rhizopus delemar]